MQPVSQRLKEFNAPLSSEMLPIKYKVMCESPYRFFRGTCHLFYEDLHAGNTLPESPIVWMCGDLHIENLGTFKGDNRLVYFDLNDFDEAILGPAIWEAVRMTTSIFVAFEYMKVEQKKAAKCAALFLDTYSKVLLEGRSKFIDSRTAVGIVKRFLDVVTKRKEKELLKKILKKDNRKVAIKIDKEKYFKLDKEFKNKLIAHVQDWIKNKNDSPYNFLVVDACSKVAGTGSIGANRYLLVLQSKRKEKEFILLDMKQADPSSLTSFMNIEQPGWPSEAMRIVSIQKRLQEVSPALLSTTIFEGQSYVMQEMQPAEDKVDFDKVVNNYRELSEVIIQMATLTASAQLRSGGRQGSAIADDLISFGERTDWHNGVLQYSIDYARQVKLDYHSFVQEYKNGYFNPGN